MFYILGGFVDLAEEVLLRLESDLHNVKMTIIILQAFTHHQMMQLAAGVAQDFLAEG